MYLAVCFKVYINGIRRGSGMKRTITNSSSHDPVSVTFDRIYGRTAL